MEGGPLQFTRVTAIPIVWKEAIWTTFPSSNQSSGSSISLPGPWGFLFYHLNLENNVKNYLQFYRPYYDI